MSHARRFADCLLLVLPALGAAWSQSVYARLSSTPARTVTALKLKPTLELGRLPKLRHSAAAAAVREALTAPRLHLKSALALAAVPAVKRGDYEPIRLAQASGPMLSALDELSPGEGPRPGDGESALTGIAAAGTRPRHNRAAAVAVAEVGAGAVPVARGDESEPVQRRGSGLKLWGIPPIRWGGDAGLDLRAQYVQGQPRRLAAIENVGLRASSFIWQPWFAQVSGTLRLTQSQDGLGASGADAGNASSKSNSVTGDGTLNLFPVSRFPFAATYAVSDSRASAELINNNYTSKRLSLHQNYTPIEGNATYTMSFDRSVLESNTYAQDVARSFTLSGSRSRGAHSVSFSGNNYRDRAGNGDTSDMGRFYATHSYRPDALLSVESLLNYTVSDYRLSNGLIPSENRTNFFQLNSFANWRPTQDSPFNLTGGARFFSNQTGLNGAESTSHSLAGNAALGYSYSRNLVLNLGASLIQAESGGSRTVTTNLNSGANYTSDIVTFGQYRYGWNAGTSANSQRQSGAPAAAVDAGTPVAAAGNPSNRTSLTARIGHHIDRLFPLGEGTALTANASESYSRVADSVYATSQTLLHSGGLTWSRQSGAAANTMLGLTLSDSRTTGLLRQRFQMVNLLANGQFRAGPQSYLNANLNIQGTRQRTDSASTPVTGLAAPTGFNTSASGSISYQHLRAFGVPRLRALTLYNVNRYKTSTRFEGDINAPLEPTNQSLEQRFDYSIGRIDARLSLRVAQLQGRTDGLIFLRLLRQFGAF